MQGRETVLGYGGAMSLSGIALVDIPVIMGVEAMETLHLGIAVSLGQNRGCGYVGKAAIALDKSLPGQIAVRFESIAIDNDSARAHRQGVKSPMHGQNRSIQYVDVVNLIMGDNAHGPGHSLGLNDRTQSIALPLGQLL